jgi:hypothetical protein
LTVFVGCGLSHIANDRDHRTTPEYSALLVLLLHGKTHSGLRWPQPLALGAANVAVDVVGGFLAQMENQFVTVTYETRLRVRCALQ